MTEQATKTNPLLQKIRLPGETFRLPSLGVFYTNGELTPDVKSGEVYVYPMTAIDEIYIKTPDKLLNGTAIYDVLRHCVPQILKPEEMLSKDVDYLLVCLRKVTYGPSIEVTWKHDCENAKEHTYSVVIDEFLKNTKPIDPTLIETTYQTTLENGQRIRFHPPKMSDVIDIYQNADNYEKITDPNTIHTRIIKTLSSVIHSVDDITDKALVEEWLATMPVGWIRKVDDAVSKLSDWGPEFSIKTRCKDCEADIEISIPLNPLGFFS